MDWIPPKSPLKHGLFVRRPLSNLLLRLLTFFYREERKKKAIPTQPKKILLCNTGTFGDVVIATAVLPVLKKNFPLCEIGFLTTSATAVVLKDHPLVSKIHTWDWSSFSKKRIQPFLSQCKAALHLKSELKNYDLAIDLYPYFPNAIPLLAKSQIPIRIGYTSGGFSRLLTHPITWNFPDRYVGHAHLRLLQTLGIETEGESPLPCYHYKTTTKDYIAVHMGSLQERKEWNIEKWIALIQLLEASGKKIILTGKGEREKTLCQLAAQQTRAQDLSNQLSWAEFVKVIQEAQLLISVDSAAIHLAAAAQTPTLELFAGINSPHMWMPSYPLHKGLMKQVSCAPCFNKRGCRTMACIREIQVADCYQNVLLLLEKAYAER